MDSFHSSTGSSFLGLWKTAVSYLWLSGFRYTGTSELDQPDEQRASVCEWCVSVWVSLCDILFAYGFQGRYLCDSVYFLSCTGVFYSCSTSCYAETAVQITIFALCRNFDLYSRQLLGDTDIFAFWSFIAPGIWNDFRNSVCLFSDSIFPDR